MEICVGWDSGPYGVYSRYEGISYGDSVADVPDAVFERYQRAREELLEAEDALSQAIHAQRHQDASGGQSPVSAATSEDISPHIAGRRRLKNLMSAAEVEDHYRRTGERRKIGDTVQIEAICAQL